MVIPKINSAHGSDTRNILNRAIDLINVQGKSIQDLVAEGQLTPTQYATLLQTVNGLIAKGDVAFEDIDINKGKLLPKHLSEEVLRMITGDAPVNAVPAQRSITTDKIAPKTIIPELTTFLEKTKNLFGGSYLHMTVEGQVGNTASSFNNSRARAVYAEISEGETYNIKIHEPLKANRFRLAVSTSFPEWTPGERTILDGEVLISSDSTKEYTFTAPLTGYVFAQISFDTLEEPKVQIEKGAEATDYVTGYVLNKDNAPPINDISADMTTFFERSSKAMNKFDGIYIDGMLFSNNSTNPRSLIAVNNFGGYKGKTAVIPIEHNREYYIKVFDPENVGPFRIGATYNDPVFIDKGDDLTSSDPVPGSYEILENTVYVNNSGYDDVVTYQNSDYNYLVIYASNAGNEPLLTVSIDSPMERYHNNFIIPKEFIEPVIVSSSNEDDETFYNDEMAKDRFIEEMNNYAEKIGMTETHFIEPAGFPSSIEHTMSARDMVKMGVQATSYPELSKVWGKQSHVISTTGINPRNITINHTANFSQFSTAGYHVFGAKTGGIATDPTIAGYHLLYVVDLPDNQLMVGAIRQSNKNDRFVDMVTAFNNAKNAHTGDASQEEIIADSAFVTILPKYHASLYEKFDFEPLYEKDGASVGHPASVTKVMTAMVMLDYVADLNEKIKVKEFDVNPGSGDYFSAGDEFTFRDALYLMMLPSSNTATHAVARTVGNIILNKE